MRHHEQFHACIEACNDCAVACDACTAGCLHERDTASLARCIALTVDCAQLCRLAAGFMSRGSESAVDACELCAQLCESCADECARHDSEHCRECAQSCRACAQQCRTMASERRRQLRGAATAAGTH
jgi:hypothetical protein